MIIYIEAPTVESFWLWNGCGRLLSTKIQGQLKCWARSTLFCSPLSEGSSKKQAFKYYKEAVAIRAVSDDAKRSVSENQLLRAIVLFLKFAHSPAPSSSHLLLPNVLLLSAPSNY